MLSANALQPPDVDGSGGDAIFWLFCPDASLNGRTPADIPG
jgi:hypothetical protein